MNDLRNIGARCGADKIRFGYLDVYHEYFSKFRDEEINILEIGGYNGASVKMWREYFPKANVIGMDVDQKEKIFKSLGGKNVSSVKFYKAKVPPITGTSSIAVVTKK